MNPYIYYQGSDEQIKAHFLQNAERLDEKGMYPLHAAVKYKKRLHIIIALINAYPGMFQFYHVYCI